MNKNNIVVAAIVGISLLLSAWLLGNAYQYKFKTNQVISVTGNANKNFEADIVKWRAGFRRQGNDLESASEELKSDQAKIKQFLVASGIKDNEIVFEAVNIEKDYNQYTDSDGRSYSSFSGYTLSQNVTVESADLDKVEAVSREISNLISQGIELSSSDPNYYYSKLEDLKLELISQASANAKQRADNIAKEANAKLGQLVKGDMGVFQITGQNDDDDYTYGGAFNTTSRKKTASITVKLQFISQ